MHASAMVLYMHSILHIPECTNSYTCDCSSRYSFALPQEQREPSTQFKLWHIMYNTEPAILTWDRAIHQGNFSMHVEALFSVKLVACTGALPLRTGTSSIDMPHLKSTHPSLYLQSSDRGINCLSKMDGSWSHMSCVNWDMVLLLAHYFRNYQPTSRITRLRSGSLQHNYVY